LTALLERNRLNDNEFTELWVLRTKLVTEVLRLDFIHACNASHLVSVLAAEDVR